MRFLSSPDMLADPQNHCNPLLETFTNPEDPNGIFIVMPWLNDIIIHPLAYVHDVVDMMLQTFEVCIGRPLSSLLTDIRASFSCINMA